MDSGIRSGRYRHYKGQYYYVYGTAKHSETEETLVVYRTDYLDESGEKSGNDSHWVRPLQMFKEHIEIQGKTRPRFEWIAEN